MIKLPGFRITVKIKFVSLRKNIAPTLGVLADIPAIVEREAFRTKDEGRWKWQIRNLKALSSRDFYAETDQSVLDKLGEQALEFKYITT